MKNKIIPITLALFFISTQFLIAQKDHMMHEKSMVKRAIAVVTATKGNSVHGVVTFEAGEKGVRVVANLIGLKPGTHGFHIHEFGDISSEDGSSAGGHFNPTGMPHSMPMSANRHAGDMGNIKADEQGNVHLDYIDPVIKLNGPNSIIGHAVIIHEKEDDFKTQPTGNAGARIAYGVVGIAK
ncbi:MAG: superoxide dismutase family protein [Ignavibacteriales bacterium]|nr:superoxide dismutase family protein [Ignavibacteriales bacterium]